MKFIPGIEIEIIGKWNHIEDILLNPLVKSTYSADSPSNLPPFEIEWNLLYKLPVEAFTEIWYAPSISNSGKSLQERMKNSRLPEEVTAKLYIYFESIFRYLSSNPDLDVRKLEVNIFELITKHSKGQFTKRIIISEGRLISREVEVNHPIINGQTMVKLKTINENQGAILLKLQPTTPTAERTALESLANSGMTLFMFRKGKVRVL